MAPEAFLATFAGHLACKLSEHLKHISGREQLQLGNLASVASAVCICVCVCVLGVVASVASGDCSIGCNLFYELQLAISVRGECVNFVCKTFTINCNRSLSAYKCTQRHTGIHTEILTVLSIRLVWSSALSTHIKLFARVYWTIWFGCKFVMHSATQQSCHMQLAHTPFPPWPHPFSAIHCTCSSFGIDVFTSVCNFLRAPEYILPKFAKLCSQYTAHTLTPAIHKHTHTHTLAGNEALTFAPSIDIYYTGYMYVYASICICSCIIYDCTLYCFNFVIILPVAAQLHANSLHLLCWSLPQPLSLSLSFSSILATASQPILLIRRQILAAPLAV